MNETVRTQIRIPSTTYAKARVLGAIHDISFNQFLVNIMDEKIKEWETSHGELPVLPEEEQSKPR